MSRTAATPSICPHHRAYDRGEVDLLPYLEPRCRWSSLTPARTCRCSRCCVVSRDAMAPAEDTDETNSARCGEASMNPIGCGAGRTVR
jgi:hypothetical protein